MSARKKSADDATSVLPKIGKPATRALAAIGITRLDQVARLTRADLLAIHGVGPKAVGILEDALSARGASLRAQRSRDRADSE